jgi:Bacterial CdiA-CT RNAse A domain/Phage portal protein
MTPKDMDFIEAKNSAAREIALAIGVPPMLLGMALLFVASARFYIYRLREVLHLSPPRRGDATYSNYAEAQRAFWRQTVLPVVNRNAKAIANWLSPAFGAELELRPDLDQVEALSPERDDLWARLQSVSFLTDDEKRIAIGYGPKDPAISTTAKFNPYHDEAGRFTTADGVGSGAGSDELAGGSGNDQLAQANDPKRYTINLVEEDARGGHAVRDHVGKSDVELVGVVDRSVIVTPGRTYYKKAQGSFLSFEAANDFTNRVLGENRGTVESVARGDVKQIWIDKRFGYPTGKEAFRPGPAIGSYIRPTYSVGVFLVQDKTSSRGYRVHTSYPHNEYPTAD